MANEHDHRRAARTSLNRAAASVTPGTALIAIGLLAAGCGGNSHTHTTASPTIAAQALGFSRCMRSHGVANYPDPSAGGEVKLTSSSGINFNSPMFQASEAACQKLAGGGPSASGSSAEILRKFLAFSKCMRAHGITDFPDPTTSPPPPAPGRTVSNDGVYLFIPITFDVSSPAYKSAAPTCRAHAG